ncbi:hypothetical protein [Mucilaginibacter aquatilis]|uniref:DUF4249 domain-containing protein n=1 Tax=Mucilaginibacter aquatilis TaxID=1517760 RepID=A0A6I4IBR1_9SPHI|nr:hypothetical protein [Mucilaginibacter aquatilis]MVN92655.1 hypothetical protein [Mucilaginibacter aquatilis]
MKIRNLKKIIVAVGCVALLSACKKDSQNIFNMFNDVTVTYNNSSPLAVTDYKLVNDGDSVYIDYTINSAVEDIYSVVVERTAGGKGNAIERNTIAVSDNSRRRAYRDLLKLKIQRDGKLSYRVYALNQKGVYIGDGYKKVVIEGKPSYTFLTNRVIYLPDTLGKILPSFFSLRDGVSYSYTDGLANSSKIDFGIYRRPTTDASNPWVYNLYATNVPVNPLTVYDISAWQKRATKFAAPQTSQNDPFTYTAVSASVIESLVKARNPTLSATVATTYGTGLLPGSSISFLTPEGKYGILFINAVSSDLDRKPFINVSVKIQN